MANNNHWLLVKRGIAHILSFPVGELRDSGGVVKCAYCLEIKRELKGLTGEIGISNGVHNCDERCPGDAEEWLRRINPDAYRAFQDGKSLPVNGWYEQTEGADLRHVFVEDNGCFNCMGNHKTFDCEEDNNEP